jgi:hypothetical protein
VSITDAPVAALDPPSLRLGWWRRSVRDARSVWRPYRAKKRRKSRNVSELPAVIREQVSDPLRRRAWITTVALYAAVVLVWVFGRVWISDFPVNPRSSFSLFAKLILQFVWFLAGPMGAAAALGPLLKTFATENAAWLLTIGDCPSCAYHFGDIPPQTDGCTVCPECSAAWQRPGTTNTEQSAPSASA